MQTADNLILAGAILSALFLILFITLMEKSKRKRTTLTVARYGGKNIDVRPRRFKFIVKFTDRYNNNFVTHCIFHGKEIYWTSTPKDIMSNRLLTNSQKSATIQRLNRTTSTTPIVRADTVSTSNGSKEQIIDDLQTEIKWLREALAQQHHKK